MDKESRLLDAERDFRRQVRKAYYRREEDFETLREYNDYLEEVEDVVDLLVRGESRGREKLDAMRARDSAQTLRSRARLDAERRSLTDEKAREDREGWERTKQRLERAEGSRREGV